MKGSAAVTLLAGIAAVFPALAQHRPLNPGEQIYRETCAECHATGKLKAPKFGNRQDWGPLIRERQAALTADGWVGVREMPPRGGKPDLSLEEFARAVVYMARAAGAKWKDPDAAMMKQLRAEEKRALEKLKKLRKPAAS